MLASNRGRLGETVYTDLLERLTEGEFPPGRRLSIDFLRETYSVSKQPLMEAFRQLAADGIVEIVPQVGCRPMVYTAAEIYDFFHVFAALEGEVAALAAERRSAEEVEQLQSALLETQGLDSVGAEKERNRRYRIANRHFHQLVHQAARSPMVEMLGRRMWDLSDYLVNSAPRKQGFAPHVRERHVDHVRVVQALKDGDPEQARESMAQHIRATADILDA